MTTVIVILLYAAGIPASAWLFGFIVAAWPYRTTPEMEDDERVFAMLTSFAWPVMFPVVIIIDTIVSGFMVNRLAAHGYRVRKARIARKAVP